MKKVFVLIVLLLSLSASNRLRAQPLALETPASQQPVVFSSESFSYHHPNHKFPVVTQVGTIMSAVGIGVGVWGFGMALGGSNALGKNTSGQDFDSQGNTGVELFFVGGAVGIAGMCMALGGLAQRHHQRYGLKLVSPKSNQMGIAYNF